MLMLLATLLFFSRLPFWRLIDVPAEKLPGVLPLWPLVGWLSGGLMVLTLWLSSHLFPLSVAWTLTVLVRLALAGSLHESCLARFIDSFGGTHRGTIGLILYFALLLQLPAVLPLQTLCVVVFCGDCWSKCCAAQLQAMKLPQLLLCFFGGLAPAFIFTLALGWMPTRFLWLLIVPILVMMLLRIVIKRRGQGCDVNCFGATQLLCELAFFLATLAAYPRLT